MRLIRGRTFGLRAKSSGLKSAARRLLRALARVAASAAMAPTIVFAQSAAPASETQPARVVSAWHAPEPWRTDRFFLETSLHTRHFHYDPAHNDRQNLVLGEWNVTEQWLLGASIFENSFGQRSQYVYGGYRVRPFATLQPLYFKLSAGIVHGYKDEYRDKIPFNHSGTAPVIVPSVGYCYDRYCSELVIFGGAGALLTFGVTIP